MTIETWFEEVLFRGRPPSGPGSDQPAEYQVTIGRQVQSALDPSKYEREYVGPLTPAQALDRFGMDVAAVVAGINTAAVNDAAGLADARARIDQLEESLADATAAREEAQGQAQDAATAVLALRERVAALDAAAAKLADTKAG